MTRVFVRNESPIHSTSYLHTIDFARLQHLYVNCVMLFYVYNVYVCLTLKKPLYGILISGSLLM